MLDYPLTEPYFSVFGKKENLVVRVFNGVHETDRSDEEIEFLFRALEK